MSAAPAELVERLYRRLLEAARSRDAGAAPLSVADLYQHLIPYRGVRGELGVLELAQYEHALLRLLAGEGGFVRLADADARRELTAELKATNPILGIYRDYAAVGVELTGPGAREIASDSPGWQNAAGPGDTRVLDVAQLTTDENGDGVEAWDPEPPPLPELRYPPPRPAPADATRVAPRAGAQAPPAPPAPPAPTPAAGPSSAAASAVPRSNPPAPPSQRPGATAAPAAGAAPAAPARAPRAVPAAPTTPRAATAARPPAPTRSSEGRPSAGAAIASRCAACAEALPDVEGVRFCPRCGTQQPKAPCVRCGTELRPAWDFCIRCGTRRRAAPAP